MSSPHVFRLGQIAPQFSNASGSRAFVNATNLPILRRLALYRLSLKPGAIREPHWHPNAHELTYCLAGSALVTVFGNAGLHDSFIVGQGEIFFVPSGALHHIENLGTTNAEFVVAFSHERPEDFGISGALGCMTPEVLANTFQLPPSYFANWRLRPDDVLISQRSGPAVVPDTARFPSPLKFGVEAMAAPISNPHGLAKTARQNVWPALRDMAMYSLHLHGTGMREPHWHPQTAELGYVVAGHARMTVLSPGASADTYELRPGDVYFIPPAYFHHIENLGGDDLHFLIFFDQPMPQDIGATGVAGAYASTVLGSVFGAPTEQCRKLPPYPADELIVKRYAGA